MTSALEGGGSGKVDNCTDKLRDHVCDKGGGGGQKNPKISWTSLMEAPLRHLRRHIYEIMGHRPMRLLRRGNSSLKVTSLLPQRDLFFADFPKTG